MQVFSPTGPTVTLSTSTTTASEAIGGYSSLAGGTVRIHNPAGQTTAFVEFGRSDVEATTTASMPIPSGATEVFGVGPATTHIAGITAADTADLFITPGQGF